MKLSKRTGIVAPSATIKLADSAALSAAQRPTELVTNAAAIATAVDSAKLAAQYSTVYSALDAA